jgi:nucleotide-binding universal stress UspA family protein
VRLAPVDRLVLWERAAQMTPTIMVPLDGSPAAEAALPWAVFLAKRSSSSIQLVGVHAPPAVLLDGETLIGSVVPDDSIRQRETDYFASTQAKLAGQVLSVAADLLDGSVISSLAEYANRLKPKWVVMLSHARGPVARFFLGETAVEFVRQSPSPVLLVHPGDESSEPNFTHVLVPLDGSELAEQMLGPAAEFAKVTGADMTLLTAVAGIPDAQPIADPAKAELYLDAHAQKIRATSIAVHCRVVPQGSAANVILEEAKAHPGTVIALNTHGRGGLSKLLWGSVADQVVRHTTSPVLVFRPIGQ